MNVKDIKIQAQLNIGMEIDLQFAMRFLNEALTKLSGMYETATIKDSLTINASRKIWVDLPRDILAIKKAFRNNSPCTNFEIHNNRVRFQNEGEYELEIVKYPRNISTDTEIPEIHRAYNYALALFVASRERSRIFGDEDTDHIRLMQEFYEEARNAHSTLSRQKRTPKTVKVQGWF